MAALVWKLIWLRLITSDDEYSLFGVVVFRRVKDEFTQKCRENKWVFLLIQPFRCRTCMPRFLVRDFAYSDEQAQKQQDDFDMAGTTEKELWVGSLSLFKARLH